jgi:hypothetical protein
MKLSRSIAAITAALVLSAGTADAQLIRFTTAGSFAGSPGCSATFLGASFTTCTVTGGVTLRYDFGAEQVLDTFGNAQFGTFTTSGVGPSTFDDVLFTLTINQTSPTPGNASVDADVYGTVAAIQGGLIWGPVDPTTFSIGAVDYTISTDAMTNGIRIDPPGIGGAIGSPQTIRGFVSTPVQVVPEPSTNALMVAGLAGIAVMARGRRRSA